MKIIALTWLLSFPAMSYAETYLCEAKAGAAVSAVDVSIKAGVIDVSGAKYILTNQGGSWIVKKVGVDRPMFDKCDGYFCESSEGFSGVFIREQSDLFTVVWITGMTGNAWGVAKGRCVKL